MTPAPTSGHGKGGDIVNSRDSKVSGLKLEALNLGRPVYRSIVAVDVDGSTKRTNPAKGKLRRILYDLLKRALEDAGIGPRHLEDLADRGDGVLILIRPYDDVPKTVLIGRLIPALTALLAEHNAAVAEPELRMRLRAVVHAGEVHDDAWGFYGDDIDVAFRLLEAPTVKQALRGAPEAPLVLVVSEELWTGIVRQGYVDSSPYQRHVQVKVGGRRRRGRVQLPVPARSDPPGLAARPRTQPTSGSGASTRSVQGAPGRPRRARRALGTRPSCGVPGARAASGGNRRALRRRGWPGQAEGADVGKARPADSTGGCSSRLTRRSLCQPNHPAQIRTSGYFRYHHASNN